MAPPAAARVRGRRLATSRVLLFALVCAGGLAAIQPFASSDAAARGSASCSSLGSNLTALGLSPATDKASNNGFTYTVWSGHVASWDGVPLQVYLTVPPSATCPIPLVSWNTGYGPDASTSLAGTDAGHWNNVWFAEQGFATLAFDQRGFDRSCGPADSSNGTVSGLPAACTEDDRHFWMTLDDLEYNTRDLQWLLGWLVDAGLVDPDAIAVSGGSMGGGLAWEMAMLNSRTVCGGSGWDPANGTNPCADTKSTFVPWTSPDGTPLHIAASVPEFGWFDLGGILLPNGTASDGLNGATESSPYLQDQSPIGIPLQAWVTELDELGQSSAFFAPAGEDPTSDFADWFPDLATSIDTRSTASGTALGSAVSSMIFMLDALKSPGSYYLNFDGDVPILALQGLDDSIMTPVQAQLLYELAKSSEPGYPISVVFGDVGHAPATNPQDLLNNFAARANAFIDYEFGLGGDAPTSSESAYLVRCGPNTGGDLVEVTASTLKTLETGSLDFSSNTAEATDNTSSGSEANALDPLGWRTCPNMAVQQDPGVAYWTWPVTTGGVLLGAPVVTLKVRSTAPDAELDTRLWVENSGTQTLISTSAYRLVSAPSSSAYITVTYEIPETAWVLAPGQTLKLEVTGDDTPTYQADPIPSTTTIASVALKLPTTDLAAEGAAYGLSVAAGARLSGPVANFGGNSPKLAWDFQATISWGDGSTSPGTVSYAGYGWYVVDGTHAWVSPGSYPTTITLHDTSDGVTVIQHGTVTVT